MWAFIRLNMLHEQRHAVAFILHPLVHTHACAPVKNARLPFQVWVADLTQCFQGNYENKQHHQTPNSEFADSIRFPPTGNGCQYSVGSWECRVLPAQRWLGKGSVSDATSELWKAAELSAKLNGTFFILLNLREASTPPKKRKRKKEAWLLFRGSSKGYWVCVENSDMRTYYN